jgi:DNA-binding transcriptional ArsR family regulator
MEYVWPGIIAAQAIYVAAKLRIADLLASGPKTIAELASESGMHPPTLERLLRALSTPRDVRTRIRRSFPLATFLWPRRGFMVSYSICLRWWHVLPGF